MNRLGRPPGDLRSPEPGAHERSGAWTIDRAVRTLATGCAEWQRPVPAVGAVLLAPESVVLRLTSPDETPPPGWTVEDHGRTWRASLRWLTTTAVDGRLPVPFPLLVSLGVTDGGRLLLNLAWAGGLIGVGGDLELARGLVRSWSRRLTTGPWSTGTRVVRVGFEPDRDFAGLHVARLVEATPVLNDPEGGVLLFADPPAGHDAYLLDQLLADPVPRWAVVAVGVEHATWRFTVGMDGTIDANILPDPVRLRP
ncbi:hypothetical protein [Micromonospora sp. KLBMP9576]|uniref:hypothetical protein n=1 Tax=Micromonospora sp. KLBMP9576 TaxID=3424769 RepID=UPI003D8D6C1A